MYIIIRTKHGKIFEGVENTKEDMFSTEKRAKEYINRHNGQVRRHAKNKIKRSK